MSIGLITDSPTTDAEKALYHQLPTSARNVWCPLRDYFIDVVVCSRMQHDSRRRCQRASGGRCCKHLDAAIAQQLQKARKGSVQ